jgi:hypothetical protein
VLDALLGVRCTLAEIAGHFQCSEDTIERAVKREHKTSYADYSRQKAGAGMIALRRKQFQLAMNGDRTLCIWLGKQWLGQRETQAVEVSGPNGAPIALRVHELRDKLASRIAGLGSRLIPPEFADVPATSNGNGRHG